MAHWMIPDKTKQTFLRGPSKDLHKIYCKIPISLIDVKQCSVIAAMLDDVWKTEQIFKKNHSRTNPQSLI